MENRIRTLTIKDIADKPNEYIVEVVVESDEDVYHAYCPVLDGCHSSGDTETEAFENIQEAVRLHLEVMIEDSKVIPGIVADKGRFFC